MPIGFVKSATKRAPLICKFGMSLAIAFIVSLYGAPTQATVVTVYAAASLTDVLSELSINYQKAHTNIIIKNSFAGSSTLAKQIINGAPADLFISADNDWADQLQERGLLATESRKKLLGNELVLISPANSHINILLDPAFNLNSGFSGRLCVGDPTSVPAGKYAKQVLTYYHWWDKISARLVATEDVRTALAFVDRGECALGIVYKTDIQQSKNVKLVAVFPPTSHTKIEYPGALTKTASPDAIAFWNYLQSDAAKAVFNHYGFSVFY